MKTCVFNLNHRMCIIRYPTLGVPVPTAEGPVPLFFRTSWLLWYSV